VVDPLGGQYHLSGIIPEGVQIIDEPIRHMGYREPVFGVNEDGPLIDRVLWLVAKVELLSRLEAGHAFLRTFDVTHPGGQESANHTTVNRPQVVDNMEGVGSSPTASAGEDLDRGVLSAAV